MPDGKPYRRGLVALSADPVTVGHIDLFHKAAARCDQLIIYVSDNDEKRGSYLFRREDRKALVRAAISSRYGYRVICDTIPMVDIYLREGCDVLFRGIRNDHDKGYEEKQMFYHRIVYPDLNVEYIEADPRYAHISSTAVKAFASHHVSVHGMVPLVVKAGLEQRLHGQYKVGITGCMGTGKTYTMDRLVEILRGRRVPAHAINIDQLVRDLYAEDTPGGQKVRDQIREWVGPGALTDDGKDVKRDFLPARCADSGSSLMNDLAALNTPHVNRLLRARLRGASGLIFIEYASMAEDEIAYLVNNMVVVVDSPNREAHIRARGGDLDFMRYCDAIVADADEKASMLQERIRADRYGKVLRFVNGDSPDFDGLADELMTVFPNLRPAARIMSQMELD